MSNLLPFLQPKDRPWTQLLAGRAAGTEAAGGAEAAADTREEATAEQVRRQA